MKIVVINGLPHAGKDTFVQFCENTIPGRVYNLSTIDKVKEIALMCGWDGQKTGFSRKFLSDLKQLLCRYNDLPYHDIEEKIAEIDRTHTDDEPIIFIHSREPAEIKKFVANLGAQTLCIRRPTDTDVITNDSDANVENYKYDYYVDNDSTLTQLNIKAQLFIRNLFNNQ